MAEILRYVNYASTPGGDGTTSATTGANRAYATITEAESAEQADFDAAGDWLHLIVIGSGTQTETITITGSTTSENSAIIIEVDSGSRHDGTPGSGLKISNFANFNAVVTIQQPWTILEGFDVENTGTSSAKAITVNDTAGETIVRDTLAKAASGTAFLNASGSTGTLHAFCLAYDSNIGFEAPNWVRAYYFGCTAGNCTTGFTRTGTNGGSTNKADLRNCVGFGGTDQFAVGSYWHADCTNNATSASVTTDVPGANPVANIVTGDFTDTSTNDWSLASGSALADAGADLTTAFATFDRTIYTLLEEDMVGTSLPQGSSWPIGAFELAGGAAAVLAGDATGQASATGSVTTQIPLSGASVVVATASGSINVPIELSGDAIDAVSASASLTTGIQLSGDSAGQSVATADLTAIITLSGDAIAQAIAGAGIDTSILLSGNAAGQSSASGDLGGGAAQLSGDSIATAQATGALTAQIQLSADAISQTLVTGSLDNPVNLAGGASASAIVSGELITQIPLIGNAVANVSGAGDLNTQIILDAVAVSVSTASGSLDIDVSLSGDAVAVVLAGGDLVTQIPLSASAVASAISAADLTVPGVTVRAPDGSGYSPGRVISVRPMQKYPTRIH